MKTTIFGVLLDVTSEQDTILSRLTRKYGFMFRCGFQPLLTGTLPVVDVERQAAAKADLP